MPSAGSAQEKPINTLRPDPLTTPPRLPDRRGFETERPEEAAETQSDTAIPYSRVFRDNLEAPYEDIFRQVRVETDVETKIGDARADFHADFFRGLTINTPLQRGFRPESAEFKLGDFYFDFESLGTTVLYSDNINQTETDREDGVLWGVRLGLAAVYQLGENFNFGLRGAVIYLPLRNDIGIAGFGIDDLLVDLTTPLFQAQVAYDLQIGHWQVEFIDDFRAQVRTLNDDIGYELFEGASFDEAKMGRYRLSTSRNVGRGRTHRNSRGDGYFLEARNVVGATASRYLPADTLFDFGAMHENRWYFNLEEGEELLPRTEDTIFANLISERDSFRFKPFIGYRMNKYDFDDGWDYRLRGGVSGPITDYINFLGSIGYFWSDNVDESMPIWRLSLDHNPTPQIVHRVEYRRDVTVPSRYLHESLEYRLRYKINDALSTEFLAMQSRFNDLDASNSGADELRVGGRVHWNFAQRATLMLGGFYFESESHHPLGRDVQTWRPRAEIRYSHTETAISRLRYEFQERDSTLPLDSFRENLLMYTFIKYF